METPRTNSNTNPGLSSTTDSMMNKASSGAHATVDKMAAAADEAAPRRSPPSIARRNSRIKPLTVRKARQRRLLRGSATRPRT